VTRKIGVIENPGEKSTAEIVAELVASNRDGLRRLAEEKPASERSEADA